MENVIVSDLVISNIEKLTNGSLLIIYNKNGVAEKSFIITVYRSDKNFNNTGGTKNYCSFVDLETGLLAFEEPCSRSTTANRIFQHLNRLDYVKGVEKDCNSYNQIIKVYKRDEYKFFIQGL